MPTDDFSNYRADHRTQQQKQRQQSRRGLAPGAGGMGGSGGIGVPNITPPIQPDWGAPFRDAAAAARPAAPDAGQEDVRRRIIIANRRRELGLSDPGNLALAAPVGPPAPRLQPPGQPAEPPTPAQEDALRQRIFTQNRLRELRSEQGNVVALRPSGLDPEQQHQRRSAIRSLGERVDDLNRSQAPVQRVQWPSEVAASRDQLRNQGLENNRRFIQDVMAKMQEDPANAQSLQPRLVELHRMREMFEKGDAFAPLDVESPEVSRTIQGQRELAQRQEAMRRIGGEAVTREQGLRTQEEEAASLERQKPRIETRLRIAELQKQEAEAQAALGAARAGASPAMAAAAAARNQAGLQRAGLNSDEAYETFTRRATGAAKAIGTTGVLGGLGGEKFDQSARELEIDIIPRLNRLSEIDPDEASRVATELLLSMPETPDTVGRRIAEAIKHGAISAPGGAPLTALDRARTQAALGRFSRIQAELRRLTRPADQPPR